MLYLTPFVEASTVPCDFPPIIIQTDHQTLREYDQHIFVPVFALWCLRRSTNEAQRQVES